MPQIQISQQKRVCANERLVQVLITDPAKLEAIREEEGEITRRKIAKITAAGANVILTTKGIDVSLQ
jgi:T-complex protein 1 subunit alpha